MKYKKKYFVSYVEKQVGYECFNSGIFEVSGKKISDNLATIEEKIYTSKSDPNSVRILFFKDLVGE